MKKIFLIDYQTIDQIKRMKLGEIDETSALCKAKQYLERKYGEIFSIIQIKEMATEKLWENIATLVISGKPQRYVCESELEAEELAEKIENEFEKRKLKNKYWSWAHQRTVHTFPVQIVTKEELDADAQDNTPNWYMHS